MLTEEIYSGEKFYSEFNHAYQVAKQLIKQDTPKTESERLKHLKDTRKYVIECMKILAELYRITISTEKRTRIFLCIAKLREVSAILYEHGVNHEIQQYLAEIDQLSKLIIVNQPSKNIIAPQSQGWAADIFKKYKNAVAEITAGSNGRKTYGTGFVISQEGYLLTNDHVVFDEATSKYYQNITMKLCGGKDFIKLELINADKKNDIALCKFDIAGLDAISVVPRIKDYSTLLPGADILVIGNALSMGLAPITGIVKFTCNKNENLVHTALSNHGDSGGPVFNKTGECIGINKSVTLSIDNGTAKIGTQGIANATPMNIIDQLLEQWCQQKNIVL